MYRVRILWKDSKIACCSQLCDNSCPNFNKCKEYDIDVRKRRDRKEPLSFNYYEKLMSHDSYSREHGVIKQKRWGKW